MVGSAVCRALESKGYFNLIGKTSAELDLRNQQAVTDFYKKEQPEVVIDAAAKVGGILANNDFNISQVAEHLSISTVTANKHLETARRAFGAKTNYYAIKQAVLNGLIDYKM